MAGGRKGHGRVTARQLAVLRMLPFAKDLGRAGAPLGLAVARLRYGVRGWNGEDRSPVADGRWALDQLAERFPGARLRRSAFHGRADRVLHRGPPSVGPSSASRRGSNPAIRSISSPGGGS